MSDDQKKKKNNTNNIKINLSDAKYINFRNDYMPYLVSENVLYINLDYINSY